MTILASLKFCLKPTMTRLTKSPQAIQVQTVEDYTSTTCITNPGSSLQLSPGKSDVQRTTDTTSPEIITGNAILTTKLA